jgi:hypothetical protein
MAVYVDALAIHRGLGRMSGAWCHMIADTVDELHVMAARIGLEQSWFQKPPRASFPHYDLRASKRALAVAAGAIEADRRQLVAVMRAARARSLPVEDVR